MSTKALWRGNTLTFYDSATHERVLPVAPLLYADDFFRGKAVIPAQAAEESGVDWVKKIVKTGGSPTCAGVADSANGVVRCALDATSEEQEVILYHSDERNFSLEQGLVFECRVKLSTLPTGNGEAVFGLFGDYAKGPDAVTYSLMFTADGNGAISCEIDDGTTDASVASGVTALATDWKIFRIDCANISDIKFFIDGVAVAASSTFAYAATGADAILQPYIGVYKASGTGVGSIDVDYVRIWQNRA